MRTQRSLRVSPSLSLRHHRPLLHVRDIPRKVLLEQYTAHREVDPRALLVNGHDRDTFARSDVQDVPRALPSETTISSSLCKRSTPRPLRMKDRNAQRPRLLE